MQTLPVCQFLGDESSYWLEPIQHEEANNNHVTHNSTSTVFILSAASHIYSRPKDLKVLHEMPLIILNCLYILVGV